MHGRYIYQICLGETPTYGPKAMRDSVIQYKAIGPE